jgi:two-component system OmpR family sensor kinase
MIVRDFNATTAWKDRVIIDAADGAHLNAYIDPDAFAMAIRNLIENGLRHGAAERPVRVAVDADGKTIRVTNEGAGVPESVLRELGRPFRRGTTRAEGSGLGLSIARGILEQAGGSLELSSPARSAPGGFEAKVTLPGARA